MSKVSLLFNNIIHFSSKKNITSINWNNFVDNLLHAKGNKKKKVWKSIIILIFYTMAKFISTSLVLVLFVISIHLINRVYSDTEMAVDRIDECLIWFKKCLLNPTSISPNFCLMWSLFCPHLLENIFLPKP
jgi:hypothetical protein